MTIMMVVTATITLINNIIVVNIVIFIAIIIVAVIIIATFNCVVWHLFVDS